MWNTLTSIPEAICLYLALISSLHSLSASLNHNCAALCHIQFPHRFTKKKEKKKASSQLCCTGLYRRGNLWEVGCCGTYSLLSLYCSLPLWTTVPFTADVFFVWLRGLSGFDIFITSQGSSVRTPGQGPPTGRSPLPACYGHTKILLWEELRIAVWTSHWAALQNNLKAPVGSFPSPCAFCLSYSSWITRWINILLLEQNKANKPLSSSFRLNQILRGVFLDTYLGVKKNGALQIFLIQAFICKKPRKE